MVSNSFFVTEQARLTPSLGEYVVVQGVADWVEGDTAVRIESVESLGKGSLPPAKPSSWNELSSGHGWTSGSKLREWCIPQMGRMCC